MMSPPSLPTCLGRTRENSCRPGMEKVHCCQTWATSNTRSSLGEEAVGAVGEVLQVLLTGTSWHQTPGLLRCCHNLCLFNSPFSDYWALIKSHPSHLHIQQLCHCNAALLCCAHTFLFVFLYLPAFWRRFSFLLCRNSSSQFPATSPSVLLQHTAIIIGTENIMLGK